LIDRSDFLHSRGILLSEKGLNTRFRIDREVIIALTGIWITYNTSQWSFQTLATAAFPLIQYMGPIVPWQKRKLSL
jgi:hypothetical protein